MSTNGDVRTWIDYLRITGRYRKRWDLPLNEAFEITPGLCGCGFNQSISFPVGRRSFVHTLITGDKDAGKGVIIRLYNM